MSAPKTLTKSDFCMAGKKIKKKHTHIMFTPELGEDFQFDDHIFSDGLKLNHQPSFARNKIPKQHLQEVQLADWHYNTASRGHTREISSAEKGGFCEWRICTTWPNNLGEMETFIYTIYYSSSEKLDHDNIGEITGRGPPCRCRIFRSRRLEAPEHVIVHFWGLRKTLCF